MKYYFLSLLLILLLASCNNKQKVDLLFVNGTIYTVDSAFTVANALAVKDGKIIFAGKESDARVKYEATNVVDLGGKFMYPGFIDGHCHFFNYANSLAKIDLAGTRSWKEILDRIVASAQSDTTGWLIGRGWDQNDWDKKEFPDKAELDKMFPDRPVMLVRIDGHALIANQKALDISGITTNSKVDGGKVVLNNNKLTGVLVDNAMDLIKNEDPVEDFEQTQRLLLQAQQDCFAVGLTTLDEAGLAISNIFIIDTLQKQGKLKMRFYVMVSNNLLSKQYFYQHGKIKTERLNVSSFKYLADGALGSRGAALKQPYKDDAKNTGLLTETESFFREEAKKCFTHGFQMNTHAIGDSANALMLKIYGEVLQDKNDRRWRIEHAQVVDVKDIPLFGKYSIIPSVQATHATSDMYWAVNRLGAERMKGAYAYQDLMQQNGVLVNGTDFPVESINPMFSFYAAVERKDQKGFPESGFQKENAITREQALRSLTIWAAWSNFEEHEKGSLEAGKLADFVVMGNDIMKAPGDSLYKAKVLQTWLGGERVFARE